MRHQRTASAGARVVLMATPGQASDPTIIVGGKTVFHTIPFDGTFQFSQNFQRLGNFGVDIDDQQTGDKTNSLEIELVFV